ncbi:hypothetical protein LTR39_006010, partial [Cryomyces antarcticus]
PSFELFGHGGLTSDCQTLEIFLKEAGLPLDAGSASKGDLTIEKILEEKKTFDLSVSFEKLGKDDDEKGWRLP